MLATVFIKASGTTVRFCNISGFEKNVSVDLITEDFTSFKQKVRHEFEISKIHFVRLIREGGEEVDARKYFELQDGANLTVVSTLPTITISPEIQLKIDGLRDRNEPFFVVTSKVRTSFVIIESILKMT
jgi:hypothetical protein